MQIIWSQPCVLKIKVAHFGQFRQSFRSKAIFSKMSFRHSCDDVYDSWHCVHALARQLMQELDDSTRSWTNPLQSEAGHAKKLNFANVKIVFGLEGNLRTVPKRNCFLRISTSLVHSKRSLAFGSSLCSRVQRRSSSRVFAILTKAFGMQVHSWKHPGHLASLSWDAHPEQKAKAHGQLYKAAFLNGS